MKMTQKATYRVYLEVKEHGDVILKYRNLTVPDALEKLEEIHINKLGGK